MEQTEEIKNFAKEIIRKEVAAVERLMDFVDDSFVEVLGVLYNCRGRIVVTGIGKSAVIGQKIVATLNSTGTPAIFMHAADAIHGDLGIVQKEDIVICLSKSGNTPEVKALIPILRSIGNNIVIAMVGNTDSFLARNAHYTINTTVAREACPNNLAPTSSSTAQLVMGDVIAVSLLKLKGFSQSDFARVHPGGVLGKRLYMRVSDLIASDPVKPIVGMEAPVEEIIHEITSKRVGATAVRDLSGRLCGIITDGDIRRMLHNNRDISRICAKEIMNVRFLSIGLHALALEAFSKMEDNKITQLIVTAENGDYCGVVHIHDILREGMI